MQELETMMNQGGLDTYHKGSDSEKRDNAAINETVGRQTQGIRVNDRKNKNKN
jgi:hypothetical protein